MDFREQARELVSRMTLEEKLDQMRYDAQAIPRLNVPAYNWWNEALHGIARAGTATVFPQAIAMAASFNAPLLHEVAEAISDEARAKYNEYKSFGDTEIYQGLTIWSPNINIFRDPRWGRGHETYGEDPCLTGILGTAFVTGLQGEGRYHKLDATLKHYAVHSGPEGERHGFNAEVSDEELYGTYLAAFRYCIEHAHPAAVMGAYNRVNGEACCASPRLLQKILREEFGFDGYVVSDCGAVCDIHLHHHITETQAQSAALAVKNGCDLNCGTAYLALGEALKLGYLTEEDIDRSVIRLFEARFRLGMFADDCEYDRIGMEVVDSPAHRELNRKMAQQSIVLLKNDGLLPLRGKRRIAVIGPNADNLSVLLGNYNGTPSRYTTLLRGIQDGAPEGCEIRYAYGAHHYETHPYNDPPLREAILAARWADTVVLCLGLTPEMEGEEGDAFSGSDSGDKRTIEYPDTQLALLRAVLAVGTPTILVNVSGSCMNLCEADEKCAAVVQCFYPGAEGGNALADVLFGRVSPSGRLPVTFYRSTEDLPPFRDYSMKGRTYRFYEGTPLYPFGWGLTYSDVREDWKNDATCEVTNRGGVDTDYSVLRFAPGKGGALLGVRKLFLKAGETRTVVF